MGGDLDVSNGSRLRLRRRLLFAGILAVLGVLAALTLGELACRLLLVPPMSVVQNQHSILALSPTLGWQVRPGLDVRMAFPEHPGGSFQLRTDRLGMIGGGGADVVKRRVRILFAGDSHTFGLCATDENFVRRLETDFTACPVETLNCAVPMFSPYQEYLRTAELAPALSPDALGVVFYCGNDFLELMLLDGASLDDDLAPRPVHVPNWAPLAGARPHALANRFTLIDLDRDAPLPNALHLGQHLNVLWAQSRLNAGSQAEAGENAFRAAHEAILCQSFIQACYFHERPGAWAVAVRKHAAVVDLFQALARERRASLFYVVLPTVRQGMPGHVKSQREADEAAVRFGLSAEEAATDERVRRTVLAQLAERRIPCLDLAPEFQRSGGRLYWDSDYHLSADGHRLVSRLLAQWLGKSLGRSPMGNPSVTGGSLGIWEPGDLANSSAARESRRTGGTLLEEGSPRPPSQNFSSAFSPCD